MLLHGFGANKDHFTLVARFLTPRYSVIVPDHLGFGESAHPLAADYAPPTQAQRLRALAQALGIQSLHLGGNSMGGQIALTYVDRMGRGRSCAQRRAGRHSAPAHAGRRPFADG